MRFEELDKEINFGLENLEKIYQTILIFFEQKIDEGIRTSALTYECFGYYNAIEHVMIRIIKNLNLAVPSGQFSHRDIIKVFKDYLIQANIDFDNELMMSIENLMAFRHVATKIYSFLIDWEKLDGIIKLIEKKHPQIKQLFLDVLAAIKLKVN